MLKGKKPDFLCIGVQKAGTCSLIHYMNIHPEIHMIKWESHFFDANYHRKKIKQYENNFITNKKFTGEKTPIYCYNTKCIDRIHFHYPEIKLIMILRDPVSRAYSQWNMCQCRSNNYPLKNKPFKKCIKDDSKSNDTKFEETDILQRGYYDDQIKYILTKFPRKNLYIGISEEIKLNKQEEYNKIYKFIGSDRNVNLDKNLDTHISKYKSKLDNKTAKYLYKIYKPHIEKLYEILGRKINIWEEYYSSI